MIFAFEKPGEIRAFLLLVVDSVPIGGGITTGSVPDTHRIRYGDVPESSRTHPVKSSESYRNSLRERG